MGSVREQVTLTSLQVESTQGLVGYTALSSAVTANLMTDVAEGHGGFFNLLFHETTWLTELS